MHDDLKSFKPKPIPKIAQKLQNFEKPQSLSKTPKVRSKMKSYQRKKSILRLKIEWGSDLE